MCICRVVKCFAFSVTGFEQICARWRAVVVTYSKSTDCANMPKAVRLKCSTEVGYGYDLKNPIDFAVGKIKGIRQFSLRKLLSLFRQNLADKNNEAQRAIPLRGTNSPDTSTPSILRSASFLSMPPAYPVILPFVPTTR